MIRRAGLAAAAGLPVALGPAGPAAAQDGGPLVVSPRPRWELIRLDDIDVALELEWRRIVDSREPPGGPETRDVENRLREILEVSTTGWMGHPNLLALDLSGRFRLEQTWLDLDTGGMDQRIDDTLLDWSVSGLILGQSRVPVTVYSRQNTADIDQQFGGSFQNQFRETGVRASLRSPVYPTNLQIFNRRIEQQDVLGGTDFTIDQYSAWADGRVEFGQAHRMAWDFKYDDVNESGDLRTPQSFQRLEANATHTYDFGARQQNSVRTRARVFGEGGARDLRQAFLDTRLRFRHSDDLQSWYDYRFEWIDRADQEQFINQGSAQVSHQLFESLTTFGRAGFNLLDIPTEDFHSNEVFGEANTEYTKAVPGGRFEAGADLLVSRLEQTPRGAPVPVTDSAFVFGPDDTFTINQRNVIPGSIRITDLAGVILFTEGVDYAVSTFADRTEIRRLPGGAIAPGQTVLVDFVVGPQPGGTTVTGGAGVDFRYTLQETFLRGLSAYGGVFVQDENRTGPFTAEFIDNDFTDVLYGLEYDAWKIYLRAERQHRDSSLSSFDATRLEGRYTERLGRGSVLVLSSLFQDIDRFDENVRTKTSTFSAQWNQQLSDQLRFSLLVQYQLIDDRSGFDSEAFEQEFNLNWRFRQTTFYAQVRNSFRNTESDDTGFQRFIVGVRREF